MSASIMDKIKVMASVDAHFSSGISNVDMKKLSNEELFGIYATCTDVYMKDPSVGGVDSVKSYLSKKYPPMINNAVISKETTAKQDENTISEAKERVKMAEALLRSSIATCRIVRGSYKP